MYEGFKKLKAQLTKSGAKNPSAVAASVARKKYGEKALEKHAQSGTSMKNEKHKKTYG